MYLTKGHGYYDRNGQATRRGRFLLLVQERNKSGPENTFACVRKVALRQCGHWMMGTARIEGKSYAVSGAYGGDGLPMDVDKIPHDAMRLPAELYEAWNKGGGWNSAGNEALDMRKWALATF